MYTEYLRAQESQTEFAAPITSDIVEAVEAEILAEMEHSSSWDEVDSTTMAEYETLPNHHDQQGGAMYDQDISMSDDLIAKSRSMSSTSVYSSWELGYRAAMSARGSSTNHHLDNETAELREGLDTSAIAAAFRSIPTTCFVCQRGILSKQSNDFNPSKLSCSYCDLQVQTNASVQEFLDYVLLMCRAHEYVVEPDKFIMCARECLTNDTSHRHTCTGQSSFSYTPQQGLLLVCSAGPCRDQLHIE